MLIRAKSRLLLIGDSITDCDRARPVGEGLFDGTGYGYVSLVEAFLGAEHPELGIRVTNMGVSGHTVRDLKARWQTDVLELAPDWLSVMIGINDVWRQFDTPRPAGGHVSLGEYEETLDELLGAAAPRLQGLVLMTPYYIEPDRTDAMRRMMDQYGDVVRRLAGRHRARFVDTQAAFDCALEYLRPTDLALDRIHPNRTGHMILARAFLAAVGDGARTASREADETTPGG